MAMYVPENYSRTSGGSIFKSKNALQKRKRNSGGVLSEDLKSIKRPKKLQAGRQRKIEKSFEKNQMDAVSFERCEINKLWERYCKQKKQIAFRLFESKMKQSKFKADALALR